MQVICLEEEAFFELVERVVDRLENKQEATSKRWIDGQAAMELLKVRKTKLQTLRDTGKIRFSKPSKKLILYDIESIYSYLEENAKDTF